MIRLCLSLVCAWCLCFGSQGQAVEEWRRALPQRPESALGVDAIEANGTGVLFGGAWSTPVLHISGFTSEGDLNGDGCVDDKDLALMLELYGTNDPAGDANEDGIVDDADLSIAFKYFGYGCR